MAPLLAVVLDASALLDGADARHPERGETVRDLQARFRCLAPALLAWEVGNVVHRKHPDAFGTTPAARAAFVETLLEGVDLVPSDGAARARCGALVAELGLTFYDAAYLELAMARGGVLVTQDRRLLQWARERGARAFDLEGAARAMKDGSFASPREHEGTK